MKISIFSSVLVASIASLVSAQTLQGSNTITPQDYIGLPAAALANNPPACGMPYNQLNLARITAVKNMNTGSTCNLCLKVVNSANPSKFVYVLAVDLGGRGLDLSIPSFEYLFGQRYDASPASWSTVDYSNCAGIYTPGKVNPNQGVNAGSSISTTTKPLTTTIKATTTTKAATTTKASTKVTTTKRTTTKRTTTKRTTTKRTTTKRSTKKANTKKTTKKVTSKKTTVSHPWWKPSSKMSKKHTKTKVTKTTRRSRRGHGNHKRRID